MDELAQLLNLHKGEMPEMTRARRQHETLPNYTDVGRMASGGHGRDARTAKRREEGLMRDLRVRC
jgi:hypothetical protein